MCGRYNLITDADALVDFFDIARLPDGWNGFQPRFNIAPSQELPIIRSDASGRELLLARWGLVPHWSEQPTTRYSTINARAETAAEKPAYREAFKRKRCLVPATGFYEWELTGDRKTPYHIRLAEGGLCAFAGLWDYWDKEDPAFHSYSILVTRSNESLSSLHERMPVILNPAQYNTWLNVERFDRAQLQSLLVPFQGDLEWYPVSRIVNSPKHDDARCVASLSAPPA